MNRGFWIGLLVTWLVVDHGAAAWLGSREPGDEGPLLSHETQIRRLEPAPEIIFYGNSMASMSLQPEIIEGEGGRPVYNHAVYVGGLAIPLWSIHRLERLGKLPAAVVVAVSPFEFGGKPGTLRLQVDRHLDMADLAWIRAAGSATPELTGAWVSAALSRAHRDRHRWQELLFDNGLNEPWAFGPKGGDRLPAEDPVIPVDSWSRTRDFYHRTLSNGFRDGSGPAAGLALLRQLKRDCDRLGVSLTILSLPESSRYPECYAAGDYDWFWSTFEDFLDREEISWIDDRRRFADPLFRDGVHLVPSACRVYSVEIGRRLRDFINR